MPNRNKPHLFCRRVHAPTAITSIPTSMMMNHPWPNHDDAYDLIRSERRASMPNYDDVHGLISFGEESIHSPTMMSSMV